MIAREPAAKHSQSARYRCLLQRLISEQRTAPASARGQALLDQAKECLADPSTDLDRHRKLLQAVVSHIQERAPLGLRREIGKLAREMARELNRTVDRD